MAWERLHEEVEEEFEAVNEIEAPDLIAYLSRNFPTVSAAIIKGVPANKKPSVVAGLCACGHRAIQHTARGCFAMRGRKGEAREPCSCVSYRGKITK